MGLRDKIGRKAKDAAMRMFLKKYTGLSWDEAKNLSGKEIYERIAPKLKIAKDEHLSDQGRQKQIVYMRIKPRHINTGECPECGKNLDEHFHKKEYLKMKLMFKRLNRKYQIQDDKKLSKVIHGDDEEVSDFKTKFALSYGMTPRTFKLATCPECGYDIQTWYEEGNAWK